MPTMRSVVIIPDGRRRVNERLGIIGARQTGANSDGCIVALVEDADVSGSLRHVEACYPALSGNEPQAYPVHAAAGSGPLPFERRD